MTTDDQYTDLKSLRTVIGKTADWESLAKEPAQWGSLSAQRRQMMLPYLARIGVNQRRSTSRHEPNGVDSL